MSKQPDVPELPEALRPHLRARLRRVEGQLRGVARMVELGRPDVEVLQQLASIQPAVKGVSMPILRSYLERCVADAARSGNAAAFDEFMEAVYKFVK